jgi:YD repeat-containing protein
MFKIDRDSIGNILKISSPHNGFVTFKHDWHNHIISATDSFGKTVLYDYDENQRLVRVDDSKDGVTHYVYSQNDNLIEIVKPDGGSWLKIGYDDRGRVADLTFQDGSSCRYRYQTDSRGMIAAVDVIPSKGPSKHVSLASHAGWWSDRPMRRQKSHTGELLDDWYIQTAADARAGATMAIEQPAQSVSVNLKGILLAVIVVCLALMVFSKLWGRRAAEIPRITRGPLHPLTPPITADKVTIIADLRARDFTKARDDAHVISNCGGKKRYAGGKRAPGVRGV